MSTSLRTLKGVGEKTEKLFAKIGVTDMESPSQLASCLKKSLDLVPIVTGLA